MARANSRKDYVSVTHQKVLPTVQSTSFLSDSTLAGAAPLSALEGEKLEGKKEKQRHKKAASPDKLLLPSAMCLLHRTLVVLV